ncbi:MAG: ribosome small subunit-dependent GTPase A [Clostridia bacterium]|nr:ribosome small subunit-dependent GTPase A [Clostridia bacterium]
MPIKEGIIIKGIGGFYYVEADDELYECKAKGIFRKMGLKPYAGDRVSISVNTNAENVIEEIHGRKNEMSRPPVANIDKLFIVSSTVEPKPVLFIIDKLTALAVDKDIEPVVVFTKCDLSEGEGLAEIYRKVGIKAFCVSNETGYGTDDIKAEIKGCVCAFCGNSGVGKSSLLNAVEPSLNVTTAAISDKLGRGKHTTRHSELYKVCGGYVADTPGFASITSEDSEFIIKENLPFAFKEFLPYLGKCKFSTCRHTEDKGCAVIDAVERGEIPESRHRSYCMMREQVQNLEDWQLEKNTNHRKG